MAIRSFKGRDAALIFADRRPRGVPHDILVRVRRKLTLLDAATVLDELASPPGNRLEALAGDRAGQHSIRVNDQWRICFVWSDAGADDVELVDYH